MELRELAQQREQQFLARYGVPNYHLLDLPFESQTELADTYNYTTAELRRVEGLSQEAAYLRGVIAHLDSAWSLLSEYVKYKSK